MNTNSQPMASTKLIHTTLEQKICEIHNTFNKHVAHKYHDAEIQHVLRLCYLNHSASVYMKLLCVVQQCFRLLFNSTLISSWLIRSMLIN